MPCISNWLWIPYRLRERRAGLTLLFCCFLIVLCVYFYQLLTVGIKFNSPLLSSFIYKMGMIVPTWKWSCVWMCECVCIYIYIFKYKLLLVFLHTSFFYLFWSLAMQLNHGLRVNIWKTWPTLRKSFSVLYFMILR